MSAVAGQVTEEDFMLETIPDRAWNLMLDGASTLDVVQAIRYDAKRDIGLVLAVKAAEKMREMLGGVR
jgi:hypothetical protein